MRDHQVSGSIFRLPGPSCAPVQLVDSGLKVIQQIIIGPVKCPAPAYQHVICTRLTFVGENISGNCPEPPLRTIAHDGIADLAAGSVADTNGFRTLDGILAATLLPTRSRPRLKDKPRHRPFLSGGSYAQKILPAPHRMQRRAHSLGREALTAPCPAVGQHTATPDRSAAGAKSVATFAYKNARLKSPFHDITPKAGKVGNTASVYSVSYR